MPWIPLMKFWKEGIIQQITYSIIVKEVVLFITGFDYIMPVIPDKKVIMYLVKSSNMLYFILCLITKILTDGDFYQATSCKTIKCLHPNT